MTFSLRIPLSILLSASLFIVLCTLPSPVRAATINAETVSPAEKMISRLGEEAIAILTKDANKTERQNVFNDLLSKNFDMDVIARFALGRYWNQATPEEQKEYTALFKKMVISIYSNRLAEYSGQGFVVTGSKDAGRNDVVVNSVVVPQGNSAKITIDWRVRNGRIIDVIVEGISMSVTQRSEFSSIIQRGGGQVAILIDHLKK